MTTKTFTFAPAEGITANVRAAELDGAWWFLASDVCRALGLAPSKGGFTNHFFKLDAAEKRVGTVASWGGHEFLDGATRGGMNARTPITMISEAGLYKLVLRAHPDRNPVVREFQDWVTRDVLPAIRKDGAYVMGEEKVATGEMSEDEFVLKAMGILQGKVERLRVERDEAVRKAQVEAAPFMGLATRRAVWQRRVARMGVLGTGQQGATP